MDFVLIGIILGMKGVQGYFNKKVSRYLEERTAYITYLAFNMALSMLFAGLLLLFEAEKPVFNGPTFWYAFLCGISVAICTFANLMALKEGAVVLVQVFATAGILVPCVAGVFLFQEAISVLQLAGMGVLIVSAAFLMQYNSTLYGKITPKMVLLLIVTLVSNGTAMLAQKLFAFYVPAGSVSLFSLLSFGIPAVLFASAVLPTAKAEKKKIETPPGKVLIFGAVLAVACLLVSQLSTVVSKTLPSVLVFPIVNGGGLILSTIIAALFFKEKLTGKSIIGLLLGVCALLVINEF